MICSKISKLNDMFEDISTKKDMSDQTRFCVQCATTINNPTKYQTKCQLCTLKNRQRGQALTTLKLIIKIPDRFREVHH